MGSLIALGIYILAAILAYEFTEVCEEVALTTGELKEPLPTLHKVLVSSIWPVILAMYRYDMSRYNKSNQGE